MIFKAWREARRKRKEIREMRRGYEYAAGALLRGEPREPLEDIWDSTLELSAFNRGICEALSDWDDLRKKRISK